MAKRKRDTAPTNGAAATEVQSTAAPSKKAKPTTTTAPKKKTVVSNSAALAPFKHDSDSPLTIQIIAGSYDRVLHGITATVSPKSTVQFADSFLFDAHASAIRCLALSPPSVPVKNQTQKVLLATGATDERINIYNLSAHPPSTKTGNDSRLLSSLAPRPILENPKNRELGTLLHHSGNITRLTFPNGSRSKLLSGAEDSTIAVTRTRDWALLHTFKCPIPKLQGRPSGDTASMYNGAGVPQGVNDFAVHPSNKIMISVSKGERCMRLWNLETGKKSRVLNFEKKMLQDIGEMTRGGGTGEARRIVWGTRRTRQDGEGGGTEDEFAVAWDRDVVVFGMDCIPRCRLMAGQQKTKVIEVEYVQMGEEDGSVLAVSTEDGRILFFDTNQIIAAPAPAPVKEGQEEEKGEKNKGVEVVKKSEKLQQNNNGEEGKNKKGKKEETEGLGSAKLLAQLGGKEAGVSGRIKDFNFLPVETEDGKLGWYIVTAGSDGSLRIWNLKGEELNNGEKKQVGKLLGTYETQNRITCVEAFIMIPRPEGAEESEYEFDDEESSDSDDSDEE
ncbi:WD40-repeat-containing domain protein [Diplogelasinospora grovesii]|uniref:WD40-repeat-containing domain protein n=1 Tax=Diplogelasinospora grovesii TaxID=303347 RepID=A0AAN6NFM6_9PEZI|nr:WD40-repeat-containing domain protein [Diplogelasinospora grovesii]